MKNYSLLEKRKVTLENKDEINLKYYLVDRKGEGCNEECIQGDNLGVEDDVVYGVKLVKECTKDKSVEEDEISGFTLSIKDAKNFIKKLADNTVTPLSLVNIVDDWITSKSFT